MPPIPYGGVQNLPEGPCTRSNHQPERSVSCQKWWSLQTHDALSHEKAGSPSQVKLLSWLWFGWLSVLLIGTAFAMRFNMHLFSAWLFSIFFVSSIIPDPGIIAWPYYTHLALPLLAMRGWWEGGHWTFFGIYFAFGMLPILDTLIGMDVHDLAKFWSADEMKKLATSWNFRITTLLCVPMTLAHIAWGCYAINQRLDWTVSEFIGLSLSVGIYTGGINVTFSHELSHRSTKLEQWASRILSIAMCYGHFYVEHVRGHHKKVGTDEDPATAHLGETYWRFLPRAVIGEYLSAWKIEAERVNRKNFAWWQNEMIAYTAAQVMLAMALHFLFGKWSAPFYFGQSFTGILLFQVVNYLEHYGLERAKRSDGSYEPVGYHHSWDSPARFSNMLFLKLQRHADHHVNAGKRYQTLNATSSSPQLPSGYAMMALIAFFPPIWFRVMDPRVMELRSRPEYSQQKFRHELHAKNTKQD